MSDKPGRNDPCYCGSGKKYKQCHMAADRDEENKRRWMAEAGRWLRRDFLKFARQERFAEAFAAALPLYWKDLYTIDNAEQMSEYEAMRFFDWFVFDYQHPDSERLIDVYHKERREDLTEAQQEVLDTWIGAAAAWAYELTGYDGQVLHVNDYPDADSLDVYEPSGRGVVQPGDLLLGRLVPLLGHLEFSTVLAYLPVDEIADLKEKIDAARAADAEAHPGTSEADFRRRQGHLIIHHALDQADLKGRPPVAARDPHRPDNLARQAAQQMRRLQRK